MSKLLLVVIAFVVLLFIGGAAFLGTWDIPPPTGQVEKVIGNDRLPR